MAPGLQVNESGPAGLVLGIGVDLVDIDRFAAVIERRPALVQRVFSAAERGYAATLSRPAPSLAARFAAKEAVMKALGVGIGAIDWTDVEVVRRPGGAPELAVRGRAGDLAASRGVSGWHISISHTDHAAAATVIAVS